ncbi:ABC transporter ATP-binding protein/permease [Staphylococcus caprae]|uniref:ABC transporter ATP-binding protein/permease n=1 Tax=Staphylococcus caprae TaxID=29380 RepID=UPI00056BB2B5|nr:ABC transporter ATP-binding protein/permease [Staphylococcus caprae]MBN6824858.1 ABC transporter ATP-binding protein/permease [Staphylococcus caprae]MBX5322130.1 ABC transporter ATP-binding protein/permease [Staphylococcus caprae]MCI2954456.1 ABC transporter ATP-binding protein/permease [Staphylococcus caprae]MDI0014992.1 ABC transporter ATP-binding protein/permease [Staphylococcus caprae]MEB8093720.1 ABC transporter ATP-binding protein/permease [Staphylococcus caprae]
MKKLTNLVFKYKIYPVLMCIVSIFLSITVVIQNISIARFLNHVLYNHKQPLIYLFIVILVVLIARATFNMLNQRIGDHMAYKVKTDLRRQVINKNSPRAIGEQMNILTESIDGIAPFFQSYLPQVFKSMMIPVAIIIAMCFVHLPTALIMMVTAPFIPMFYIIFGLKTRDESKDQMTYLNQFSQRFLNTAKGLITLKLLNRTKQTKAHLYEDSTRFRDLTMRILKSAFLSGLMLEFISMLGIGLVALEAALSLVVFNSISFVTAAIAIILAPEFYNAIKDLGQAFHTGKQSEGSSDVVFDFLEAEDQLPSPTPKVNNNQEPQIKVENVSYRYPGSEQYALRNINITIYQNDKIAIVGPSGAGKTTLAHILSQSVKPSDGEAIFNMEETRIGFLSQNPYIFTDTIKNNIAMYDYEISDEDIIQVLDEVGLKDKVLTLKDGIDTRIGEGGEMLSGGQMRRLELSRLLLMKPELVIFDEPATGLDIETERTIQAVLQDHFKETTMLIIAHRDTTINQAERRIYLENGQLIKDDATISVSQSEVNR